MRLPSTHVSDGRAAAGGGDVQGLTFHLVVPTVGRRTELLRLLDSLAVQTYPHVVVTISDQSAGTEVASIAGRYASSFEIEVVRSRGGASRARNAGLERVTGDIVGFPDDDAWFDPSFFEKVADALGASALDGLTCRVTD